MNIKSALLGAALVGSMLVGGAAHATTNVEFGGESGSHGDGKGAAHATTTFEFAISGEGDRTTVFDLVLDPKRDNRESEDGFKFGPVIQITDGKKVEDTYRFFKDDERSGFSDKLGLYNDVGGKFFINGEHGFEFIPGDYKMYNRESERWDDVKITTVSGVPETSTWLMMLSGFAGLGFLGYRRSKLASVAA
ncbi:hypothetical protein [uncultured Rhodoblastus sp.]|uniref:hypothetical protein n=1 Tax=uncultured Rhodoblastus sp. TaxID=543037 RepID=UPI0025D0F336|nr:hypothetical protein [uncultured Rhodoblastus sp.]